MSPVRAVITAPPLSPPKYGLILSSVLPKDDTNGRWVNGFEWDPEACGDAGIIGVCDDREKEHNSNNFAVQTYDPFIIFAEDHCSTMTHARDRAGRAQRLLNACQSRRLEHELWTGEGSKAIGTQNPYLASPDTEILADGDPVALRDALAALEEARAACACGGQGMVHMTVQTAILLASVQLIRREGDILYTILNTIVVPGAGYTGSSPDTISGDDVVDGTVDESGATAWMYVTGLVNVRLGEVITLGAEPDGPDGQRFTGVDRSINDQTVRAERAAAATFDPCCLIGINTDLRTRG